MLTSTKPRSPPRTTRTPHPPPISYRPSSQATITAPASPSPTPTRGHRPSISTSMHWLSRSSTQSSAPYTPSKPTRISEPKLVRSIELLSNPRTGVLGAGATIVRTPEDALRETRVRLTSDSKSQEDWSEDALTRTSLTLGRRSSDKQRSLQELSPPSSPPFPPLPLPQEEESEFFAADPQPSQQPPRPTRTPPPAPPTSHSSSRRSSLKSRSLLSSDRLPLPQVPPLPANIPLVPTPPPFRPILTSDVPTGAVDRSKIIVMLETCTTTYRTTLETLQSRHSQLSTYLTSLLPKTPRASAVSSVYSTTSDDISAYRHHLASQGLLPAASYSIHIFLDRPSAPYAHVLNYLRSSTTSPDTPETLPRSVYQQSSSHLRLESLLELRDEAAYLNLDGLHKLCVDEIRLRQGPRFHVRGHSTSTVGSANSLRASICTLHTLLERVENDIRPNQRDSKSSDSKSIKDSPTEVAMKSPPTPESWNGSSCEQRQGRCSPSRPPPAGWI